MRCSNSKCGIDIKSPLDLYNGDMACPRCRKKIELISREMQLTEKNSELYELAELWYSYGLSLCVGNSVPEAIRAIGISGEEMIQKALALTMEASLSGHPEARWRLAFFYDKDYAESDKTESVRVRLAGKYYSSIFESSLPEFTGYGREQTLALKHRAARDFIKMLSLSDKTDREYLHRQRDAALAYLSADEREEVNMPEKSDAESLKALCALFSSEVRAPLFGVFTVSQDSVADVADIIRDCRGFQLAKTSFAIIPLENEAGMIPASYRRMRFSAADTLDDDIDRAAKEGCGKIALFFLNLGGKHVKRLRIKPLYEYFVREKSVINMLDRIVTAMSGRRSVTFYDDDIIFYNKTNAQAGLEALVARIGED